MEWDYYISAGNPRRVDVLEICCDVIEVLGRKETDRRILVSSRGLERGGHGLF